MGWDMILKANRTSCSGAPERTAAYEPQMARITQIFACFAREVTPGVFAQQGADLVASRKVVLSRFRPEIGAFCAKNLENSCFFGWKHGLSVTSQKITVMNAKDLNRIGYSIVGAAMEVHKRLGPGLLESLYQKAMEIELKERHHKVESEVQIPVYYREKVIANELRVDLLVDEVVIIELKSVVEVHPVMHAQLLTYLKLTDLRLGYLINFHEVNIMKGLHRMVNHFGKAA